MAVTYVVINDPVYGTRKVPMDPDDAVILVRESQRPGFEQDIKVGTTLDNAGRPMALEDAVAEAAYYQGPTGKAVEAAAYLGVTPKPAPAAVYAPTQVASPSQTTISGPVETAPVLSASLARPTGASRSQMINGGGTMPSGFRTSPLYASVPVTGAVNGGVLGQISDIISGVGQLLPKLPIPLPGAKVPAQLPGQVATTVGGLAGKVVTAAKGPAGRFLKVFGILTAAGLTADQISALISSGAIDISPRRRRRGISPTELRGFHKVCSLLGRVGMKASIRRRRRKTC